MVANYRKKHRQPETADFLGVKESTLEYWRWLCAQGHPKGPPFLKVGGIVYYLESDLIEFLESCRVPAQMAETR